MHVHTCVHALKRTMYVILCMYVCMYVCIPAAHQRKISMYVSPCFPMIYEHKSSMYVCILTRHSLVSIHTGTTILARKDMTVPLTAVLAFPYIHTVTYMYNYSHHADARKDMTVPPRVVICVSIHTVTYACNCSHHADARRDMTVRVTAVIAFQTLDS
jgi:hypothetical protein